MKYTVAESAAFFNLVCQPLPLASFLIHLRAPLSVDGLCRRLTQVRISPQIFELKDIMDNPYVAADGFTYEHDAIKVWVDTHSVSPVTKHKLPHKMLTPNLTNLTFTVCIVLVMRSTNMETSNTMRVGRQWRQSLYKKKGKAVGQVTFAFIGKSHVHLRSTEHSSTHGRGLFAFFIAVRDVLGYTTGAAGGLHCRLPFTAATDACE
ncbi:U-box domain-containing protein [Striga asiatica]|uniref:U-box domain-containing protein n=1 Tax=Striga asiatica TaxID=4170 RepID=A0A5A7Q5W5_STRAF|nr:U-box domain-containing protein [Striga asiatica]